MKGVLIVIMNMLTYTLSDAFDYRLPTNVLAIFYNITIDIDLDELTFQGYSEITVDVLQEKDSITMHALELTILEVDVVSYGEEIEVSDTSMQKDTEFLILHFDDNLEIGTYTIAITYQGVLNKHSSGLFVSNYTNDKGEVRYLAMTHFQTMDARRAFPCFDEPDLKANFSINVVRDEEYISVSNMPLLKTTPLVNGRFCDTFETTPKMSTYLVAFSVSDFVNIPYARGHIYVKPTHIEGSFYAAEISPPIISSLETYLEMPLPLKKLDMIAMPHLTAAGIENWGLIAYLESNILYVEGKTGRSAKQATFLLILHECTHQWFGDLITSEWWTHIWLSEGLATLYEHIIGDEIMPGWRLKEQLVIIGMRNAIAVDGLNNSRDMSMHPAKPRDFEGFFDTIAYEKAGAVLLTLRNAIGVGLFKTTIEMFLATYSYSTASGHDLWELFQDNLEVYNSSLRRQVSIPTFMKSWEHQAGVPVLNVNRNYESGSVQFTQERFLFNSKNSNNKTHWYIPINFATASNTTFDDVIAITWLTPSSNLPWVYQFNSQEWLIVNKQASFYYLVNYDERNWKLIASALDTENFGNIPALTRAQLWNDAFTLARSGRLKYSVALELTKYLRNETDYIVLNSFFYVFEFFYQKFSWLENFHLLQTFLAKALEPALEKLGVAEDANLSGDEQHIDTLNRVQVIKWSCFLGNQLCWNLTAERLANFSSISTDLKQVVVCGGMRGANVHFWEEVFLKCTDEDPSVQEGFGCIENKEGLEHFVQKTLKKNISAFAHIYSSGKVGINFVLTYMMEHLKEMHESLSENVVSSLIVGLSSYLSTSEHLSKLQHLSTKSSDFPKLNDAFSTAISRVKTNMNWVKLYSNDITYWINKELSDGQEPTSNVPANAYFIILISILLVFS